MHFPALGSHAFGRLCYSLWLFHLHSAVKIQPFYPVFPLAGSTAKAFFQLSLWNFKEKSINHFYNTAFWKGPVMVRDCAIMQQNNHQGLILGDNWSP